MGGGHGPWGLPGGGEGYSVHAGPAVARDFCLPFVSICPASAFPLGGRCSRFAAQPSALREWAVGEDEGLKFRGPGPWVPLSLPWGRPCQLDCWAVQALTWPQGTQPSETCGWKAALRSRSCCPWPCGGNQWTELEPGAEPPPNPALQAAWPAAILPSLPAPSPRGLRPAFPFSPQPQTSRPSGFTRRGAGGS